jgi:hypothetical protein
MKSSPFLKVVCAVFALALASQAQPLLACAACFGKSDSPLAAGMNWGIFSLLVCIVCVLGGVASFFFYLAKKASTIAALRAQRETPESTQKA